LLAKPDEDPVFSWIPILCFQPLGNELEWVKDCPGRFWRHLTGDSQLRWIGPDKGAIHLATGVVVNAIWDLWANEAVSLSMLA
jgi:hypothetical protein